MKSGEYETVCKVKSYFDKTPKPPITASYLHRILLTKRTATERMAFDLSGVLLNFHSGTNLERFKALVRKRKDALAVDKEWGRARQANWWTDWMEKIGETGTGPM